MIKLALPAKPCWIDAPLDRLVAEGEGSGSAPNGTTVAEPDTAGGAATPAIPAPAEA